MCFVSFFSFNCDFVFVPRKTNIISCTLISYKRPSIII